MSSFSPQYIQTASLQPPGAQHRISFTNLSSQQLNPGSLVQFLNSQSASMQPMPYTDSDIETDQSPVARQLNEMNNVSSLPRRSTLSDYFHTNDPDTKDVNYGTPSLHVWDVPPHLWQARATDMF